MKADFFKAIGHPTRLELINALSGGPLCVCELFDQNESTQPNISQHLKILKDADILESSREGNKIMYRIKHEEVFDILKLSGIIILKEIETLKNVGKQNV
ncbi:MAG: winged helix-turn-helix transcriptional regulator [Clostridia bacterium]|nr:winged helix-turn-helix transcriptional regulator [Clostridia bacterium]